MVCCSQGNLTCGGSFLRESSCMCTWCRASRVTSMQLCAAKVGYRTREHDASQQAVIFLAVSTGGEGHHAQAA